MGRSKQPVSILEAKGKTHLSKADIEKRRSDELSVDLVNVTPPPYLGESMADEFMEIAAKLAHVDERLFTELDEDVLARYLIAKGHYLRLTQMLSGELKKRIPDVDTISKLQRAQNSAFSQCHTCASALGLTITSRCKIVIPSEGEKPKENRFSKFEK